MSNVSRMPMETPEQFRKRGLTTSVVFLLMLSIGAIAVCNHFQSVGRPLMQEWLAISIVMAVDILGLIAWAVAFRKKQETNNPSRR